jgi:GTP cyclohydrolase I
MTIEEIHTSARGVDRERIAAAMTEIIAGLGEDPRREGLRDTPSRVAAMYGEVFAGLRQDPGDILREGFEEGYDEMVVARDIGFFSMCEHHFLPFFGVVHIGYIPQGRVVGISKLARVTEIFARRPQLQERLTTQIADAIVAGVEPMGVGVVVEAEHLCMVMRGIKKPGSRIITSVNRGVFRTNAATRAEFLGHAGHQAL